MSVNKSYTPDWPAPARVKSLQTTRVGGASIAPYGSFNLGDHVGDLAAAVAANRHCLPSNAAWLTQTHRTRVVDASEVNSPLDADARKEISTPVDADASFSRTTAAVCVVMTADCLPILLCDQSGSVVAAAHAGWRGLCDGVIENTVTAMQVPNSSLMAWLGPAIGPTAFEVGGEVRAAFIAHDAAAASAFIAHGEKWLADLYQLARQRLNALGITAIYGGQECTFTQSEAYFSYRRDGVTGRMASLIWLENEPR